LQSLKEEVAEERKRNEADREILERKILKLNNELSDIRSEVEKRPTTKRVILHDQCAQSRPADHHHCTSGSSIVATSINKAVGGYSF
jgi:hypothetical protein